MSATLAKPDLANAHYNLAFSFREKGEIQKAIDEMNIAISQVKKDSQDYKLAKSELENLKSKKIVESRVEGSETLTPPEASQGPILNPPLELPHEATLP